MNILKLLEDRLRVTDHELLQMARDELIRLNGTGVPEPTVLAWLVKARSYLGLKEYKGREHNTTIVNWWIRIQQVFRDDETPWCAAFVGGVLEEVGIASTKKANARSYTTWGRLLDKPAVGCIVVFWRGKKSGWKGHVGFVTGKDEKGRLLVLGGNQSDAVNIKAFPKSRVLSYRWPKAVPLPVNYILPTGGAGATTGEA